MKSKIALARILAFILLFTLPTNSFSVLPTSDLFSHLQELKNSTPSVRDMRIANLGSAQVRREIAGVAVSKSVVASKTTFKSELRTAWRERATRWMMSSALSLVPIAGPIGCTTVDPEQNAVVTENSEEAISHFHGFVDSRGEEQLVIARTGMNGGALEPSLSQKLSESEDALFDFTLQFNNIAPQSASWMTFSGIDGSKLRDQGKHNITFAVALPDSQGNSLVVVELLDETLRSRQETARSQPDLDSIYYDTPRYYLRVGTDREPFSIDFNILKSYYPSFNPNDLLDLTLVVKNDSPTAQDIAGTLLRIGADAASVFAQFLINPNSYNLRFDPNTSGRMIASVSGFVVTQPIVSPANHYDSAEFVTGSDLGGRNSLVAFQPVNPNGQTIETITNISQLSPNQQIVSYNISRGSASEGTDYAAVAILFEDNLRFYRGEVFRMPVQFSGSDKLAVTFVAGRNEVDANRNVIKFNEEKVVFQLERPAHSDPNLIYEFRVPTDEIIEQFNFIRTAKRLPIYSDSIPVTVIPISPQGGLQGEITTYFQNVGFAPVAPGRSELRTWKRVKNFAQRLFNNPSVRLLTALSGILGLCSCIPPQNHDSADPNDGSGATTDEVRQSLPVGVEVNSSSSVERTNGYSGTAFPVNAETGVILDYSIPIVTFNLQGSGSGIVIKDPAQYPQLQVQVSGSELYISIKDLTNPSFPKTIVLDKSNFPGLGQLANGSYAFIDVNTILLSVIAERPEYVNFRASEIFIQHNGPALTLATRTISINGLNFLNVMRVDNPESVSTHLVGNVSSFAVNGRPGILTDQFDAGSGIFTTTAIRDYNQAVGVVVNDISETGSILVQSTQATYQIEVTNRNNPSEKKIYLVGGLEFKQISLIDLLDLERRAGFVIGSVAIVAPGGARAGDVTKVWGNGVSSNVAAPNPSQTIDLTDISGNSQNWSGFHVVRFGAGDLVVSNGRATVTTGALDPSAYTSIAFFKPDGSHFALDQTLPIVLNNINTANLNYLSIGAQDDSGHQVSGTDLIALGIGDASTATLRTRLIQLGLNPDRLVSISVSASGNGQALLPGQTTPIMQVINPSEGVSLSVDTNGAQPTAAPTPSEVIQASEIVGSIQNFSSLIVRHQGAGTFVVANGRGTVAVDHLDPSSYASVGFSKQDGTSFALNPLLDIVLSNIETGGLNYLTFNATDADGHGVFGSDIIIIGTQDVSTARVIELLTEKGLDVTRLTSLSVGVSAQGRALLPSETVPINQVENPEEGIVFSLDLNGARSELRRTIDLVADEIDIYAKIRSAITIESVTDEMKLALGAYLGIDFLNEPRDANVKTAMVILPELGFEAGASIRAIAIANAGKNPLVYLARIGEDAEMVRNLTLDLPASYQIKSVNAFEYLEVYLLKKEVSEILAVGLNKDESLADRLINFLDKEVKIRGRKKIVDNIDQFLGIIGLTHELANDLKAELLRRIMA